MGCVSFVCLRFEKYIYKFKYHHSTMKCRDIYNIFQHQYHGIATAKRSIKNGKIWSYIILYISTGTLFFSIFLCCWCLFMFNQTFICKYLFPLSPWNIVHFFLFKFRISWYFLIYSNDFLFFLFFFFFIALWITSRHKNKNTKYVSVILKIRIRKLIEIIFHRCHRSNGN